MKTHTSTTHQDGSGHPRQLLDWIARMEAWLASLGLFLMLLLVCTEIILRNIFNTSFLWSEELSRYLLIWSTYFSAASLIHQRRHLRIELLVDRVRRPVRKWLDILAEVWVMTFSLGLTWAGYKWVSESFAFGFRSTDSDFPLQLAWIYLVIPATFGLSALHAAGCLYRLARTISVHNPGS